MTLVHSLTQDKLVNLTFALLFVLRWENHPVYIPTILLQSAGVGAMDNEFLYQFHADVNIALTYCDISPK